MFSSGQFQPLIILSNQNLLCVNTFSDSLNCSPHTYLYTAGISIAGSSTVLSPFRKHSYRVGKDYALNFCLYRRLVREIVPIKVFHKKNLKQIENILLKFLGSFPLCGMIRCMTIMALIK